jgi:HEAT repeat protein
MASAGLIKLGACPEEILPDLVETLRDPDLRVRANGVAVFVKLETLPAETETLLVNSVGLPKTALRRLVALALRKFDTATAREALQALTVDPDERVKQIALESLRILEPESTQPDEEKAPIPVDASVALALPAEG